MSLSANEDASALGQAAALSLEDAEQRVARRYTPLMRTAKITGVSGEFLCVVSDISATGVSVRLFHPLPRDTALKLEMPNGDQLAIDGMDRRPQEGRAACDRARQSRPWRKRQAP